MAASLATTPSARTPLDGSRKFPLVAAVSSMERLAIRGFISFVTDHVPLPPPPLRTARVCSHIGRNLFDFVVNKRLRSSREEPTLYAMGEMKRPENIPYPPGYRSGTCSAEGFLPSDPYPRVPSSTNSPPLSRALPTIRPGDSKSERTLSFVSRPPREIPPTLIPTEVESTAIDTGSTPPSQRILTKTHPSSPIIRYDRPYHTHQISRPLCRPSKSSATPAELSPPLRPCPQTFLSSLQNNDIKNTSDRSLGVPSPVVEGSSKAKDGGPEDPVIAVPVDDIVLEGSEPHDVTGHFSDLFIGVYNGDVRVAMKRLRIDRRSANGQEIKMLEREAKFWLPLKHPHILDFMGIYRANDYMYLVSPFMVNGNLASFIMNHPEQERVSFLLETADAVAYLHGKGVVHGDIKARNILVSESHHAKLCDFGLAKYAFSITASASKGQGSSRWQSPEILDGDSRTFASDTYAFGITISEVLSGAAPFPHLKGEHAVIHAVMARGERPARFPTHSQMGESYERLWNIAAQCWDGDPQRRPRMSDVHNQLCDDYKPPQTSSRLLGAGSAVAEEPAWDLVWSFDPVTSLHPSCPSISSEIGIT